MISEEKEVHVFRPHKSYLRHFACFNFLLLDFDPEEVWPGYFVKNVIDVVMLV